MARILTRERMARVAQSLAGDGTRPLDLSLADGVVAVINEIQISATLIAVGVSDANNLGRTALALTTELATSDLPGYGLGTTAEFEWPILEQLGWVLSGQDDGTVGSAGKSRAGRGVNYRALRMLERPMTTEVMEQLSRDSSTGGTVIVETIIHYQLVLPTEEELTNLFGLTPRRIVKMPDIHVEGLRIPRVSNW